MAMNGFAWATKKQPPLARNALVLFKNKTPLGATIRAPCAFQRHELGSVRERRKSRRQDTSCEVLKEYTLGACETWTYEQLAPFERAHM
eukprot:2408326-Pyramimonas_sp.AAC.1